MITGSDWARARTYPCCSMYPAVSIDCNINGFNSNPKLERRTRLGSIITDVLFTMSLSQTKRLSVQYRPFDANDCDENGKIDADVNRSCIRRAATTARH